MGIPVRGLSAEDLGRLCAVAAQTDRVLNAIAIDFPDLFPRRPFDAGFFSTLSLNCAFCAPELAAPEQLTLARVCLWVFGVDWAVDYGAGSAQAVADLVRRCGGVLGGRPTADDDPVGLLLGQVARNLADTPGYEEWRKQVEQMLEAMGVEWGWRTAVRDAKQPRPSLEEYLDNAASAGFGVAFASYWALGGEHRANTIPEAVADAARTTGQVLRLANDLGTLGRDENWGDVNAFLLGITREQVDAQMRVLLEQCHERCDGIREEAPGATTFLERQVGFNAGLYGLGDYWGSL